MATLRSIDAFFHEPGKAEWTTVPHQAIVSFASLVGNPNALADFAAVLKGEPNVRGEIYGMDSADQPAWRSTSGGEDAGAVRCARGGAASQVTRHITPRWCASY